MSKLKSAMAAIISSLAMIALVSANVRAETDNHVISQANDSSANSQAQSRLKPARKQGQHQTRHPAARAEPMLAQATKAAPAAKSHRLILQVNSNEPAMMNLVLNNATNVAQYYSDRGEPVSIEVVTFGPGLHMLRDDTSPVKPRIEVLAMSHPEISFRACANTQENMRKAESKDIKLISQATVVESGVVRVMELQEQGWSYVKP
ncbi:hypothetical protein [Bradyrhizobium sp. 62B]|uniref:DsrE family protein n=1 Tax=Bradyrhizobium sp. 62B TaxID=2898442 RepID=UPI0035DE4282